ncbi:MAG: hypothetical protein ACRD96_02245 [Bryobacteraceae bacterium]
MLLPDRVGGEGEVQEVPLKTCGRSRIYSFVEEKATELFAGATEFAPTRAAPPWIGYRKIEKFERSRQRSSESVAARRMCPNGSTYFATDVSHLLG